MSYTMDGRPAVTRPGRVGDGDVEPRVAVQPDGFNHVAGDYGFFFQALPTGPLETTVTSTWIVHEDAVEGVDYDLARLIEVWSATNDQDRALSENNQRGAPSRSPMCRDRTADQRAAAAAFRPIGTVAPPSVTSPLWSR